MMTGHGERMSDEDAEEMLREGDLDGDGVISYREFCILMVDGKEEEKAAKKATAVEERAARCRPHMYLIALYHTDEADIS